MNRNSARSNREEDHRRMVKTKPLGLADRTTRSNASREQRKQLRDERIGKARKIPLSDLAVNVVNNANKDLEPNPISKNDARRLQLLKWREERKKRAEEQEKCKKKVFVVKHVVPPSYPSTLSGKPQMLNKKDVLKKKLKNEDSCDVSMVQRVTRSTTRKAKLENRNVSNGTIKTRSKTGNVANRPTSQNQQTAKTIDPKKRITKKTLVSEATEESDSVTDDGTPKQGQTSFVPSGFTFQPPTGQGSFSYFGKSFSFKPLSPNASNTFIFPTLTETSGHGLDARASTDAKTPCKFREMVDRETTRLQQCSGEWRARVENALGIPEDVLGMMRSVVGQIQLLVTKKFRQFRELIELSEDPQATHKTLDSDLQGFWDMMYFQIEDIDKKIKKLDELKMKNWEEPEAANATVMKKTKKKVKAKQSKKTSCDSRNKLREFMRQQREVQSQNDNKNSGDSLMFVDGNL